MMSIPHPAEDVLLFDLLGERTLELCRIDSVIGREEVLADHMEAWARRHFAGEDVWRTGHSLVLGRPAVDGRPTVALFGHLDTVPPHPGDPSPHRDGGDVVGLGSSDMKGGLAVMQLLAERLDRDVLPFNLVYVLYEREEGPYLENGLGPVFEQRKDLEKIDLALCLEPSDNAIQMGCCGALHATITFEGRSAHSARPWQGENAIHKAGPLLTELLGKPPVEVDIGGLHFREVMSVTTAQGGRARNVIPEAFSLNLNYRFAPGKSPEQAMDDVRRLVDGRAKVEFIDVAPAGMVFTDHPIFQRLIERTIAPVQAKQAWTDVGRLAAHGIRAVNFGPGASAQAHQAKERVAVQSLVEGYRLLERFLLP